MCEGLHTLQKLGWWNEAHLVSYVQHFSATALLANAV